MTRSNLNPQFGQVVAFPSFQVTFADLTAAATTQTLTFPEQSSGTWQLSQGSFILYVRIKHSVAFSGGGITAMTVQVGKSGGANNFFAPAFDVFQAVADGTLYEGLVTGGMGQLSAVTPNCTFTSVGANVSAATAGTVNIDICAVSLSTPTFTSQYSSGQVL